MSTQQAPNVIRSQSRHEVLIKQVTEVSSNSHHDEDLETLFKYHQPSNPSDGVYRNAILQCLQFESRNNRFEAIPDAYANTFEWALKEPGPPGSGEDSPMRSCLPEWLEGDSKDPYWITGKPGSGKSTMMKYLASQPRTRTGLENWASPRRVLLTGFYSWNAGKEAQKSQEGLLRTLLHQIISQAPETAPQLLPGRWVMLKLFSESATQQLPPWTWQELYESIAAFNPLENYGFNIAIFIDGLDEFDGNYSQLIDLIKLLHSHTGIKVCVSSRPWNEFRDAFASCPNLRMELLTQKDITTYVRERVENSIAFRERGNVEQLGLEELLSAIVEKSSGVFLWVTLVTTALMSGLADGNTIPELRAILNELPPDLSDLFTSLWKTINPIYKRDRARLLLLYRTYTATPEIDSDGLFWPAPMRAETLWLADSNVPMDMAPMLQTLTRRLNSRTRGLLEITLSSASVDYLHRTARDWINDHWPEIELEGPDGFDYNLAILGAMASKAPTSWMGPGRFGAKDFWLYILPYFCHASRVVGNPGNSTRLSAMLDTLKTSLQSVPSGFDIPDWVPDEISFIGLAAEYAIVPYVRTKASGNKNMVLLLDLISRTVLGPGQSGIPDVEMLVLHRDLTNKDVIENIQTFVSSHLSSNHMGRYQLAAELIHIIVECSKGKTQLKHLSKLADKVAKKHLSLGGEMISISAKGELVPYWLAVWRLLKDNGVKGSLKTQWRMSGQ